MTAGCAAAAGSSAAAAHGRYNRPRQTTGHTWGSCSSCSAAKDSCLDPSSLRACRFTAACTRFSFFCLGGRGWVGSGCLLARSMVCAAPAANSSNAAGWYGQSPIASRPTGLTNRPTSPNMTNMLHALPASPHPPHPPTCFFFLLDVVPLWKAEYMSSRLGPLTAALPSSPPPSSSLSALGRGRSNARCAVRGMRGGSCRCQLGTASKSTVRDGERGLMPCHACPAQLRRRALHHCPSSRVWRTHHRPCPPLRPGQGRT